MTKHRSVGSVLGFIATTMALLSFILGSAPFTPAMLLVFPAVLLATVAALFGSWRLDVITVYFSTASWFVVPMVDELAFRIDYLLLLLGAFGAAMGAALFYGYKRAIRIT